MAIWKFIPGYEGIYQASNEGEIRSVDRVTAKNAFKKGAIKKQNINSQTGYPMVSLWKNGVERRDTVHVLILETFKGPRPKGYYGCHNYGDKLNNTVDNLRWDTPTSNNLDRIKHGNDPARSRTHCPRGHKLEEPNLVASKKRIGIRECQACSYAQSKIYTSRKAGSIQEVSDNRYEQLIQNPIYRVWKGPETCKRGHTYSELTEYIRNRDGKLQRECRSCMRACEKTKNVEQRFLLSWEIHTKTTGEEMSDEMKEQFNEFAS